MSLSPSNSGSSSSENESDNDFQTEEHRVHQAVDFLPYDEELEPLATEEEATEYETTIQQQEELEQHYQQRYTREVAANTWCTCSHCSVLIATKAEECQCCEEIDQCAEVMGEIGREDNCITLHPGFRDVCLNKYVLEVASLGLKTKAGKRYRTIYVQGQKSENEYRFLRSVAYRQFTRLLWDHLGSSKRYTLPCCAYSEIRKQFPGEDENYHGFEDENTHS